jgi:membrane-associated phospholipid phosphatase
MSGETDRQSSWGELRGDAPRIGSAVHGGAAVTESRRFTFVDYATLGYVGLVGLMVLFVHGNLGPSWPLIVAAHAACLGLIYALVRYHDTSPRGRVTTFLRYFYPMLLYGPFYWETGKLNHLFISGFLDPYFIRADGALFGTQPSVAFMDRLPYLAVSEVFYAAYFSYYLMIAGVALALYLQNRVQFFHYLSVTSFVFYVCYLAYIVLPVVGPLIFYRDIDGYQLPAAVRPAATLAFPAAVQAGPFSRLMVWVYYPFETPGASFPSSHVAVAIVTVYFSFLYLRRIRWPHFVAMILLCAATVYCRYHYVVDVLGGCLAAALIPLGNRLYNKYGKPAAP